MSGYQTGVLIILCFNIMAAYAVYLPLVAGQLNLGIAGFMAVGAYTAAYLTNEMGWSLLAAIPTGGLAAGALALLVAVPILRTHGIYLALATFALGQVISAVFLNLEVVGAAAGYPVSTYASPVAVFSVTAAIVLFVVGLSQTRFTLYLTAIKNDRLVADLLGLKVWGLQVAAFVLGGAIAGIGGGLYAHHFSFIEAQHFSVQLSIYTVLYVLLGGTQTVWGPLVGALFFSLAPELLRAGEAWRYVLFAVLIVGFMAVRPQGLVTPSSLRSLGRLFKRKPAGVQP
ncbi:branched-chain amino acid ABC transporter permease [Rhodopseudomonas sp. AAP120]|uniref:branched-chain amino acid ABC transporter permease n=1 Tax=Rhodopseudomonas sp. AAP120 TaxID=1523430 RepID=UPI0006B9757A|nr:branched-chain amino acid ABC transporter permease [Rhodopseudomonas sp. AAP120]KPF96382.1 branched-chain amino acid ABC transporter permease [Rhodopseudomonas sp. AAP120]